MSLSVPPVPISAVLDVPTSTIRVTFDKPIRQRATWNNGNWTHQFTGASRYAITAVSNVGLDALDLVRSPIPQGSSDPIGLRYDPPPFQVRALTDDSQTIAFIGFPVT